MNTYCFRWFFFMLIAFTLSACSSNPTSETSDKSDDIPEVEKTEKTVESKAEELGETKGIDRAVEEYDPHDRKHEKAFYVFAYRGLNMRETADPRSTILQVVPFGAKVEITEHPSRRDMFVDGYAGGMARVTVDGQEGYMFDGYLCRFPTPEKEMVPKDYVEHIKKAGSIAIYHHERLDDGGYIQNTEGVIVPTNSFDEAFLMAKVLFGIPDGLYLPPPSKKAETRIDNPDKDEFAWNDDLTVKRNKTGEIEIIHYSFRTEGYGLNVFIEKDSRGMKVAEMAIAD
ncbi:MAG: SH3 domain-containing protein [Bacteroidota bacterium]